MKENANIDDLCDSLETVQKTWKQTEDNDTIWRETTLKMPEGERKTNVFGLQLKHKVDDFSYKVEVDLTNMQNEELRVARSRLTNCF